LSYFYSSFDLTFTQTYEDNIGLAQNWVNQFPNSVTAKIALAISLYHQGWSLRSDGYVNTVSPDAWKPFKQYLERALAVLKEAEKLNAEDPDLYAEWITVGLGLGDKAMVDTAFNKGIAIDRYYYPLYYCRCYSYLPKWLGTQGEYEKLAAQAADLTKDKFGDSFYFLLACKMTNQVNDINEFKDAGFDFNRIMQGQKDFTKQFPDAMDNDTCNNLCFIACASGEKEFARDYFMDIGDEWNENIWKNSENFQKYKSWARNRN
jgi:hypothetical protein